MEKGHQAKQNHFPSYMLIKVLTTNALLFKSGVFVHFIFIFSLLTSEVNKALIRFRNRP